MILEKLGQNFKNMDLSHVKNLEKFTIFEKILFHFVNFEVTQIWELPHCSKISLFDDFRDFQKWRNFATFDQILTWIWPWPFLITC